MNKGEISKNSVKSGTMKENNKNTLSGSAKSKSKTESETAASNFEISQTPFRRPAVRHAIKWSGNIK